MRVLILVLVEYVLLSVNVESYKVTSKSLNPCFSGICSFIQVTSKH